MRSILSIADLSDDDVEQILQRAGALRGLNAVRQDGRRRLLSLIFLEASLRTRVGFAAAAGRLGWQTIDVFERRYSPTSQMEAWSETLRTVAGYSDVVLVRPGQPLGPADRADVGACALVNGGDTGPRAEHPSQSLVDLFAIEQLIGPIAGLRLAIVGDPRMRAVRSLTALLTRRPPAALAFVADAEHLDGFELPLDLRQRAAFRSWGDLGDVDVVYVAGIPHDALPLERRDALLATAARVHELPRHCVVLSPMPVIDEMDACVRASPRNLMFRQSDLGLFVRMALLEHVVSDRSWS